MKWESKLLGAVVFGGNSRFGYPSNLVKWLNTELTTWSEDPRSSNPPTRVELLNWWLLSTAERGG